MNSSTWLLRWTQGSEQPTLTQTRWNKSKEELSNFSYDQSSPQYGTVVQIDQEEARPQPDPKRKKTQATFFMHQPSTWNHAPTSDHSETVIIKTELENYLLLPEADHTDPLQWWKSHKSYFSRFSNLGKKYLSIPGASATSERVFSVGEELLHAAGHALSQRQWTG